MALAGFLLLLGLAVAVALLIAGRRTAAPVPPPPVLAQVPDFELVNRDGEPVAAADLRGAPWVADLIFTRCTLTCPRMTERMRQLGRPLRQAGARRVSITVDPEHDTPEVLAAYADEWRVDDPRWLFLTGPTSELQSLVRHGLLLPFDPSPPPGTAEPIVHSTRFVLVDAELRVRGYYDAFRPGELERLLGELAALGRHPA